MSLPGFFLNVDLGNEVLADPTINTSIANLNAALVMADDDAPVKSRWTTWGLEADAMFLYQSSRDFNRIFVGNNGFIYRLDDDTHHDNGVPIPVTWTSGPLPAVDDESVAQTMKRSHEIKWTIRTTPPSTGLKVTVTLIDVDTGDSVSRDLVQTTTQMHVDLTLRARQFRIMFTVLGTTNFDIVSLGFSYQQMSTRKFTRLS